MLITGYTTCRRSNPASTDPMSEYWNRHWGIPLPIQAMQLPEALSADDEGIDFILDGTVTHTIIDLDAEEEGGYLLPGHPFFNGYLVGADRSYLIRAEYIRLYDYVENLYVKREQDMKPPVVVITGQPGIGGGACSIRPPVLIRSV